MILSFILSVGTVPQFCNKVNRSAVSSLYDTRLHDVLLLQAGNNNDI